MKDSPRSALLVLDLANISGVFCVHAPKGDEDRSAQLDLNKLKNFLGSTAGVNVSEAIACTHTEEGRERYLGMIRSCGYRLVTRPLRVVSDGNGGTKRICNLDAEVAAEAMLRSADHSTVIVGSGDADFVPLVNTLRMAGKDVFVASHRQGLSGDLMQAVGRGRFIDLATHHQSVRVTTSERQRLPGVPSPRTGINRELGMAPSTGQSALLLDSQFLSNACRGEGWQVDYRKFANLVTERFGPLAHVTLFERENPTRAPLLKSLQENLGWRVVSKTQKKDQTCSTSVEISCAAIETAREGHSVILCTGSGHLRHLVNRLQQNGCDVGLAAPSKNLSASLRSAFDENAYLDVSKYRGQIAIGSHQTEFPHSSCVRAIPAPSFRQTGVELGV